MLVNHIISEIYNSMIGKIILINDSIVVLDYGYQFIRSLHIVIVGHGPEFRLIVIYIRYYSAVDFL